jgi:hypothetical protein
MSPTRKDSKTNVSSRRSLQTSSHSQKGVLQKNVSSKQKKVFLQPYVDALVKEKLEKGNKNIERDTYTNILSNLEAVGITWVTLDSLKSKVKRAYKLALKNKSSQVASSNSSSFNATPPPPGVTPSDTSCNIPTIYNKGGRPKGSTMLSQSHLQKCITEAQNEITDLYYDEYLKAKSAETEAVLLKAKKDRVSKGTFQSIHDAVKSKRNLPSTFHFSYNACQKRISKQLLNWSSSGNKSPLHEIEPHIVTLILALADTGNPITVGHALPLINSLINGTQYQLNVIEWKKKHRLDYNKEGEKLSNDELGQVGVGYWRQFLKRHKNLLHTNKGRLFELNRTKWTKYSNFRDMYLNVEEHMIKAKVAEALPEGKWMNKTGEEVCEEDAYGMKVTTKLLHPHCCLTMDETGGDTSMMNDGNVCGEKFVGRKGQAVKRPAGKKAKKYTTIGLTGLDGKPAMCIIIFSGKKRNVFQETGVDTSLISELTSAGLVDPENSLEFFEENFGEGKMFPGGPTCEYNEKKIPCMIRYSKKGGITPDILTDILKTIDTLGVFEKEREKGIKPFLLLDGHQSRFSIEFLEYITDPEHTWKVCIGVPYGTALWQVGDSFQQNGRYKMSASTKKKIMLRTRISQMISDVEILPSDIIVIVNHAWNASFADVPGNIAAVLERGWNPLNKNLLLLEELRKTMTDYDREWEKKVSCILVKDLKSENNNNNNKNKTI